MATHSSVSPISDPENLHSLVGSSLRYKTRGGIEITRSVHRVDPGQAFDDLVTRLNTQRGVLLASSYEYPGRYTRSDIGLADPPLQITARQRELKIEALNQRGKILLGAITWTLENRREGLLASLESAADGESLAMTLVPIPSDLLEEERSRVPSVFSILRVLIDLFHSDEDHHLGLFGAFGYDLAFQCEAMDWKLPRDEEHRDLVLYIPDEILAIDHAQRIAVKIDYDFSVGSQSTEGLPRSTESQSNLRGDKGARASDHKPGEYEDIVRKAKECFAQGDLFEAVPGQTFSQPCQHTPAQIFHRLRRSTPAPYGLFVNLGRAEHLVGASPEMYVRVTGQRIETCPISGTISRGGNALGDAEQIRELLNSKKEEAELTMCTDVDRNDKSRVCTPGSVRVIGRRQIEIYSKLIHTVDHVEGYLRDEFDGLDAFIAHTWAVTVTGAPKIAAMNFLEQNEKSVRHWYGGAVGKLGFDGSVNTGLTLRTIRIVQGQAQVRAGATLLWDSDPEFEAAEIKLKASALLEALNPETATPAQSVYEAHRGQGKKILLVDHRDSFVHTLANYLRQTGAQVVTLRPPLAHDAITQHRPDLVFLSPGPHRPDDFGMRHTIDLALTADCPIFGVCLGLQGLVEYFGGTLDTLDSPMHGKPSKIIHTSDTLFKNIPQDFMAGRYHSLVANPEALPKELIATARSDDGKIMAIEHKTRPIAALQFHPESILSGHEDVGLRILDNALEYLLSKPN